MKKEKIKIKKIREKSTFWKDFKAFISRGNILDLAVAVVVGAAFTAIVNSLVNDIIKPLITAMIGGEDMSGLVIVLREIKDAEGNITQRITLNYGNFLMAILIFLIDAIVIFTALRIVRKTRKRIQEQGEKLLEKIKERKDAQEVAEPAEVVMEETVKTEVVSETSENKTEEGQSCAENANDKQTVEALLAEIRDLLKEGQMKKE